METIKRINFILNKNLAKRLELEAEKEGVTKSKLIRNFVRDMQISNIKLSGKLITDNESTSYNFRINHKLMSEIGIKSNSLGISNSMLLRLAIENGLNKIKRKEDLSSEKIKILLIEDDKVLAKVVSLNLKKWGYGVDVCYDGNEGLEDALNKSYSLIITDISLPGTNGLQIVEELKTKGFKLPVIIITNFFYKENEIDTYKLGANIFHKKPIESNLLKVQIKMLIENYTSAIELNQ